MPIDFPPPGPLDRPAPDPNSRGGGSLGVQSWTVTDDFSGQRIDNFLLSRLKGVPKTRIYRMLRSGEVRVNGGRIGADYRIQANDILRIPPVRVSQGTTARPEGQASGQVSPASAKAISEKIAVVFEDDGVLAINKPAGIAVHGGSGVKLGVIEALRQYRNPIFLELVHRLDRETSGLMLLAKKRSVLTGFHQQLREGRMKKRYLALVWGAWPKALEVIDQPLHKWVNAKGERWVRVDPEGQTAITRVTCLQQVDHAALGRLSLLRCEPITGRTHQLRVHLAFAGCPILGDPKYGKVDQDEAIRALGFKRMFLHAWQLQARHPVTDERLQFEAALDPGTLAFLKTLSFKTP